MPECIVGELFYIIYASFFSDIMAFFEENKRIISLRPLFEYLLHPGLNCAETRV